MRKVEVKEKNYAGISEDKLANNPMSYQKICTQNTAHSNEI